VVVVALLGVLTGSAVTGSAAASNTTGVTCKAALGGAGFSDSHCVNAVGSGAAFVHESLSPNTSTPITITEGGAPAATFKSTVSPFTVAISCNSASGTGILNTAVPIPPREMYSWGTAEITFGNCGIEAPLNFTCTVFEGTVKTSALVWTTEGQGMGVEFAPETGATLAKATISGCSGMAAPLNGTWPLEGTVVLTPHGATLTSTHAETTMQGTLTFVGGNPAGLTTNLTVKSKFAAAGIAFTT
jgi:hypothetical protein